MTVEDHVSIGGIYMNRSGIVDKIRGVPSVSNMYMMANAFETSM